MIMAALFSFIAAGMFQYDPVCCYSTYVPMVSSIVGSPIPLLHVILPNDSWQPSDGSQF